MKVLLCAVAILFVFVLLFRVFVAYLRKESDKATERNMREARFAIEDSPNGWDDKIYRDLTDQDFFQVGDIFYNPEWEVGGPWYFVTKEHKAVGEKYVPGKMKRVRRRIVP